MYACASGRPSKMASAERKRRFHRRSKLGCQACKLRHVRCDERKPLCTHCLHSGKQCVYPAPDSDSISENASTRSSSPARTSTDQLQIVKPEDRSIPDVKGLNPALNNYVGGYFDELPDASKRLLQHFSQYSVWGEQPRIRELQSSAISKAFENRGHMHMCLLLSACQWAWVTGSLDEVRLPFLFHKAATYEYVRRQLSEPQNTHGADVVLAISALALAEGAVGELHSSSQHLRGVAAAIQSVSRTSIGRSLPQRMLNMVSNALRTGIPAQLVNISDYRPTFMALLFSSIWDVAALPPKASPMDEGNEDMHTHAVQLWQNHTRGLGLDQTIFRLDRPDSQGPQILNGDPRSSRSSFIATFFYLCGELGQHVFDAVLVDWILEQLIDDVDAGEQYSQSSPWWRSLWMWCVLFGTTVARSGRATNPREQKSLNQWNEVFDDRMRLISQVLGIYNWEEARAVLAEIVGTVDEETDMELRSMWDRALQTSVQEHQTLDEGNDKAMEFT